MADIRGWFNFREVYEWVVNHFCDLQRSTINGDGDTSVCVAPVFVEIGVWKGASIIHLCRQLLECYGSNFELFAVDNFSMQSVGPLDGGDEYNLQLQELRSSNMTLLDLFVGNVKDFELEDFIQIMHMDSVFSASAIKSADFVFIDGDHSFEGVTRDIKAWRGRTGILAGHDAYQDGVRDALVASFGEKGYFASVGSGGCWTTHPLLGEYIVGLSAGTESEKDTVRKENSNAKVSRQLQEAT